jgi:CAAX prenyl protease-like protein
MTLRELRSSPGAAWAGPLLIFLALSAIGQVIGDENASEWYWRYPEQWMYPLQTAVTLAAIAFWWKHYTFRPLDLRIVLWSMLAGAAGIALWILPSWLYDRGFVPEISWLGFTSRTGDGFDPTLWQEQPALYWSVIFARFVRMTIAVALAEELFWRGFLWRTLSDPYRDFSEVPFAQWSWKSFAAVVVLIVFAHMGPDRAAALLWGVLISLLYLRTRSVGACVVAHASANLLLGIYVMKTQQWGFW